MKKLLVITLVAILALSLTATALAALPDTKSGSITDGQHTLLKWEGDDVAAIKGFTISFNVTNFDKYAESADGADVQIVINSDKDVDTDWVNLSQKGGVFGEANGWGNTMLKGANASYTYMLDKSLSGGWLEVGVGNWNGMEGTFTVTVFKDAPSTGVTTFLALAGAALFVSGTGAVVVSRKLKNK